MDDDEAKELLDAVRDTTARAAEARRVADEAAVDRRVAIEAAMDAGLPREEIASAAGVHRNLLYRITGKTKR